MLRVFLNVITMGEWSLVAVSVVVTLMDVVAAIVCGTATMPATIATPINRPANSFDIRFSFCAARSSYWCSANVNAG